MLAEHNAWIALDSGCGGLDDYEWSLHAAMWQQLANPLERFAALGMVLRAVDAKSLMRFLRLPRQYARLLRLVSEFGHDMLHTDHNAISLYTLFKAVDVWRQPESFVRLLNIVQACVKSPEAKANLLQFWQGASVAVQSVRFPQTEVEDPAQYMLDQRMAALTQYLAELPIKH